MRGKSNKADDLMRMMTFAFHVIMPLQYDGFPDQLAQLGRKMMNALDAAEHGPGALELGRWADDGGPTPDE